MIESILAAADSASDSAASAGAGVVLLLIGAAFYFLPTIPLADKQVQWAAWKSKLATNKGTVGLSCGEPTEAALLTSRPR